MKVKHSILVVLVLLMITQCSIFNKKDDDNNKNAFLALALIPSNCTLGGEEFIVDGNITCANNEASGTGKLIATKDKELVSLKIEGTLNADDSEIILIGAADSSLSGSGFKFGRNIAKAFHPDGTSGGVNMDGFAPTSNTFTHCVEIHTKETPPHLVAWRNSCPTSSTTNADYNSEDSNNNPGGTSEKKGSRWGIILKNAKVSISINSDEIFQHSHGGP